MSSNETFEVLFSDLEDREDHYRNLRMQKRRKGRRLPRVHLASHQILYCLPDCGHVFTLKALERALMAQVSPSGTTDEGTEGAPPAMAIRLLQCPTCRQRIFTAARFEKLIKQQLALYQAIKTKFELPKACDGMPIDPQAMEEVLKCGDLQAGKWFYCPKLHPYRIEDKEASHVGTSLCPDCKSFIGASRGQLQPANRFFNLDAEEPAYKTHGMRSGMPPLPPSSGGAAGPSSTIEVRSVELIINPVLVDRYQRRKAILLRQGPVRSDWSIMVPRHTTMMLS